MLGHKLRYHITLQEIVDEVNAVRKERYGG
jgi:hypothetical protein